MITKSSAIKVLTTLLCLITTFSIGQTPGLIYKPAGTALGRSILDPNGDGFVSTTIAGFSNADYGASCELNMVTLPIIAVEPSGDLNTGSSGGHTDIVSVGNNTQESCYILYKTVNGTPYLVVRFRLGGASTSTKGYSLLLDVDGNFGTIIASNNPGFEKEVVLQTGSNGWVAVYNHSAGGTVLANQYPVNDYHQRSIALSTVNGNPDYFYDYYVPYNDLNLTNQPVRIAVATVTSASSGISGTISDFNGINDALYNNNPVTIANAIINAFPATPIPSMVAGFTFSLVKSAIPVVNSGITTSSNSISGSSSESNGTVITIYKNGVSIGTATVSSNSWTLNSVNGLVPGNLITAKATAPGKGLSDASGAIEVTAVPQCYTPVPTGLTRASGQTVNGTFTHASGSPVLDNTVQIRLYNQTGTNTFQEILANPATPVYVASTGQWTFITNLTQPNFNAATILATATYNGCTSGYSVVSKKTSGNVGVVTAIPQILTTSILASPTVARTVEVRNIDATPSYLKLYINSIEVASSPATIATNASYIFTYTGFIDGEVITSRAQSATIDYWLSDPSVGITVQASAIPTVAPVLSGTYLSGSNKTVSGTSMEPAGTVITLYKASTTLLGTTTVTSYNTWAVTGLTLNANDVLTATAKAAGKTLSPVSNSITVAASAPTAPAITGSYSAGATSVSGTGGLGTITVYIDGSPIGTTSGASWTLTGIGVGQLYKGAVITATNTLNNIQGPASAPVTVTGVNSFLITAQGGGNIANQMAGVPFNITVTAKDGASGTGNTVNTFTGTVVMSSSSASLAGTGATTAFSAGVLTPHSMNLITAGTNKTILAVSTDDPTAVGNATVSLISPNVVSKLVLNAPADIVAGNRAAYTVTRTDAYNNTVTTGALTVYLSTSGTTGLFYDAATNGSIITSVLIPDGQSSATLWFFATAADAYTVTVSDAVVPNGNTGITDASDLINVNADAASKYIVTLPANVPLGTTVSVEAALSDQYNNPVTTAGLTVNWSSTNGGTFSNPTSITNSSGVATISFTPTGSIGSQHTITATTGSYTGNGVMTVTDNNVIWNGSLSVDWATAVNWTPNVVPNQYISAIIPSGVPHYPLVQEPVSDPASCRALTIYAGASVTIGSSGALTVIEDITNHTGVSGLVIESGGSLLNNTPTVPATVKRFITGNTDFHLLSVPVAASTFGAPFDPSLHFNIWIRRYDEPTGDWSNYFYTQDFIAGKGYSIYMDNTIPSVTANFTGLLNVSSFTPELSNANPGTDINRKGWNLIGNPYASAIDWDLGTWNRSNIDGAVYVWNDETGNYVNWNGTAGDLTNGIIPVAQGFFVKVTGSSPSITIPSDARVHSGQPYYKSTSADVLRIGVNSTMNDYSDATFIGFSEHAGDDFDNSLDAWKLYGELEAPQIYTMINDLNVSINMLHKSGNSVELPVYFEAGPSGNYTLSFSGLEAYGEGTVFLTDNLNNTKVDIVKYPSYSFTADNGADPQRFKLGFTPVGINENPAVGPDVLINSSGKEIQVSMADRFNGRMLISNLAGQTLYNTGLTNNREYSRQTSLPTGIYLVTVISHDFTVTKKVYIK